MGDRECGHRHEVRVDRRLCGADARHRKIPAAALAAALSLNPAYLGVVASRKRFENVRQTLLAQGIAPEAIERIRNPAGLDIGASTPEEIALSILAQITKERREAARRPSAAVSPPIASQARDPVCGMTVEVATATHRGDFEGQTYYFCCGGCRERFLAEPQRYLAGDAR